MEYIMALKKPVMISIDGQGTSLVTFILFWQTAREVSKYIDTYLFKNAKLSTVQLIVLQSIDHNKGVMKPSEIAHWTHTERHNITTLVQRMKKDGLVRVERDKKNRRTVNVFITEKGRVVLEKTTPIAQEAVDQVMSSISDDDMSSFQRITRSLRENAHQGITEITR